MSNDMVVRITDAINKYVALQWDPEAEYQTCLCPDKCSRRLAQAIVKAIESA